MLWFGKPEPKSLWRRAYRADWVIIWFAAVMAWNFYSAQTDGGAYAGLFAALVSLGLGAGTLAILGLLAWLGARSSLYVVTERRLVIKTGIAVPIFINLPFSRITAANVRDFRRWDRRCLGDDCRRSACVLYCALAKRAPLEFLPTRADLALCAASTDGLLRLSVARLRRPPDSCPIRRTSTRPMSRPKRTSFRQPPEAKEGQA